MVHFERLPRGFRLRCEQALPAGLEETFAFFADAGNLEEITPPWLRFRILTPRPVAMTAGTRIEYRLRLHGAPIFWRTEITDWSPPVRFVDAQLRGPYRTWVHTHTFEPHPEGTLVRDQVDYDVPGGAFIHWLLVRRDLRRIFEYRAARLERIFSSKQSRASGGT